MIKLSDFKVGQEAIMAGGYHNVAARPCTVTKIGRVYVTVSEYGWERRFYAASWAGADDGLIEKTEIGDPAELFPDGESYEKSVYLIRVRDKLHTAFEWSRIKRLSYDQLKRIEAIVDENV